MNTNGVFPTLVALLIIVFGIAFIAVMFALVGTAAECAADAGTFTVEGTTAWCRY